MIFGKFVLAIVVLIFIAWLIGGLTRDRTSRRRRRRHTR